MEWVLKVILLSDRTSYYTFCELRYSLEFQLTQDGHINPFKNKEEIKNFCDQFCQKMIDGIQQGKVLSSFLVYLPIITRKKWWWFLFYKSCQRESVLSHWSLKSWIGAKTFIFLYNLLTLSKSNHSLLVRETLQFQTPYNFPKKRPLGSKRDRTNSTANSQDTGKLKFKI